MIQTRLVSRRPISPRVFSLPRGQVLDAATSTTTQLGYAEVTKSRRRQQAFNQQGWG